MIGGVAGVKHGARGARSTCGLWLLLLEQGFVGAPVGLHKCGVDVRGGADALVVKAGGEQAGVAEVAAESETALRCIHPRGC
jgi:hypothetical protein